MDGIELALRDIVEELKTMNARLSQLSEINLTLDAMYCLEMKDKNKMISEYLRNLPKLSDIKLPVDLDNIK